MAMMNLVLTRDQLPSRDFINCDCSLGSWSLVRTRFIIAILSISFRSYSNNLGVIVDRWWRLKLTVNIYKEHTLLSILKRLRSLLSVALLSPCVKAPRLSRRFATVAANLRSPASSEIMKIYSGALTWLERCVRPEAQKNKFQLLS